MVLGPLLQKVWDACMTLSSSPRKVVVVHPPFMPKAWEEAMLLVLLQNLQAPAVVLMSSLEVIPLAVMPSYKRGMVVQVGLNEARCMAHVDSHPLPYTLEGMCAYMRACE